MKLLKYFKLEDLDMQSMKSHMSNIVTVILKRSIGVSSWLMSFRYLNRIPWNTLLLCIFLICIVNAFSAILDTVFNGPASLSELVQHIGVRVSESAQRLPKQGRLLCFVITSPKFYATRTLAVNETWLPRCDHGQFFSKIEMDPTMPHSTVLRKIPDDYKFLFQKTLTSFHYAFTEISDKFDWYFKADDDTYVVMEHMYKYLATLDPSKPYYLGYMLKPHLYPYSNDGGSSFVLSRAAVKIFLEKALFDRAICPVDKNEDRGINKCLRNIGIFPHDTRTHEGQHRFNKYGPNEIFLDTINNNHLYNRTVKTTK
ncbi:hypothetical protein DICVIV_11466 [Dictyocaulus viviparus]|uniref:N-acetylgalactosaminide beta-1,3-galactosyltransferase n=1 Tax=Dictyocaulus viviparus TaxID=29172 RepID=A0A0D8XD50_DICVI|nr:hypothetical protein DICVIV_11466 [Dictyocaulus viviparus]